MIQTPPRCYPLVPVHIDLVYAELRRVASRQLRKELADHTRQPFARAVTTGVIAPAQVILVQHWFEELKRLVPTH